MNSVEANTINQNNSISTINTQISGLQGVDVTQNTRLNSIETVNGNQNTSISIIQGVDLTQNTTITAVNNFAAAAFAAANSKVDIKAGGTIIEYSANITSDYTITAGKNALSAGPITINDSVTVTIPDDTNWTIV